MYQGTDNLLSQSLQLPAAKKIKFNTLNNQSNKADKLILVITNINNKPTTYLKAIKSPDVEHWLKAMKVELVELEAVKARCKGRKCGSSK